MQDDVPRGVPQTPSRPKINDIGRCSRVWAYKEEPLEPKSTPQELRDHESLETQEHATSDITAWTMKPEKQQFWYDICCGKWKPAKHKRHINETMKKHPSILTQFLHLCPHFLRKSFRTTKTSGSTKRSTQRFWYDVYCSEFQSNGFVQSFSMRCQDALDGYTPFGSESELQQQEAVSRGRPNRRRVTTSCERY